MELATIDDIFLKKDISGLIEQCKPVFRSDKVPMQWVKLLPKQYEGMFIKPQYILLDTKRSKSNYVNTIGELESRFCLDNRSNVVNVFLREQAILPLDKKSIVRLAEYLSTGSTTILDCGDHIVESFYDESYNKGVILRRVKSQSDIPSGKAYKHISEKQAELLLQELFPANIYNVVYEPFTINFAHESACIDKKSIHCYNVDFYIRKKTSFANIGIEVKQTMHAWNHQQQENIFKVRKYEERLGAPCFLLVVEPTPTFYDVGDSELTEFVSNEAFKEYVEKNMNMMP